MSARTSTSEGYEFDSRQGLRSFSEIKLDTHARIQYIVAIQTFVAYCQSERI